MREVDVSNKRGRRAEMARCSSCGERRLPAAVEARLCAETNDVMPR